MSKDEEITGIHLWMNRLLHCSWLIPLTVIIVYFFKFTPFHNFPNFLGNQTQFAQFGDFIGGVINPILGFFTIILLIMSIRVQMAELEKTRIEMEMSREELARSSEALDKSQSTQRESFKLQLDNVKQQQVNQALKDQYELFESIWNRDLMDVGHGIIATFNMIFDEKKNHHRPGIQNVLQNLEQMLDESDNYKDSFVAKYLKQLGLICNDICIFTEELYGLLHTKSIAVYHYNKANALNEKLYSHQLITEQTKKSNAEKIKIPDRFNS